MLPIYNDLQIVARAFGTKHPQSMGQPASACGPESWHITGPRVETTYHSGPGIWMEDLALEIHRPIRSNMAHQLAGVLVAGISARLRFDELYSSFLELVTTQIATAIANARA